MHLDRKKNHSHILTMIWLFFFLHSFKSRSYSHSAALASSREHVGATETTFLSLDHELRLQQNHHQARIPCCR